MTKVSWKRILQRAGNDFPDHDLPTAERAEVHAPHPGSARAIHSADVQNKVAGELENELRRALQQAQDPAVADQHRPAHDPRFTLEELKHIPRPLVPLARSAPPQAKRRGGAARNIMAVSLSVAVVGFAIQQFSENLRGSGGGGGGGGQQRSESPSAMATMSAKERTKLVQTGYAIQPLIQPGNQIDLAPVEKHTPSLVGGEKASGRDDSAAAAAATFKRDMEDAVKLFETKQVPISEAPIAVPAKATPAAVVPQPIRADPRLTADDEDKLLQRASGLLKQGDVTGARLLFEHLAYRGSALGAFALAQSYDARYLEKLYVRGLAADQTKADFWYRRAAELGKASR